MDVHTQFQANLTNMPPCSVQIKFNIRTLMLMSLHAHCKPARAWAIAALHAMRPLAGARIQYGYHLHGRKATWTCIKSHSMALCWGAHSARA